MSSDNENKSCITKYNCDIKNSRTTRAKVNIVVSDVHYEMLGTKSKVALVVNETRLKKVVLLGYLMMAVHR